MSVHPNARMTLKGRVLLVQRVCELRWAVHVAAAAAGISARTAYKWLARYRAGGVAALIDRSSRPGRIPHRTAAAQEAAILALRARRLVGAAISRQTAVPRSTVGAVLRRHAAGRLRPIDPREPVRRYERARPGELVHVDIKQLGRIRGLGHRITGDWRHRPRGIGWEFVHVCIDDASRTAYVEVLPTDHATDAHAFLARAVAWFAARGVRVERVMTDNGAAYRARAFRTACAALHLRHLRTRPYRPQTNGKAERFIQTLLREWAYAAPYVSSAARRRALKPWLRFYNHERPHSALRDRSPITRLLEAAA